MPPAARTPPASDPSPPAPTPPRGPGLLPPRPTRAHVSGPTRRARARPSLKPDLTGLLPRPRPGAPRRRGWWEGHRHGRRRLPASRGLAGHRRRPPGPPHGPCPPRGASAPAGARSRLSARPPRPGSDTARSCPRAKPRRAESLLRARLPPGGGPARSPESRPGPRPPGFPETGAETRGSVGSGPAETDSERRPLGAARSHRRPLPLGADGPRRPPWGGIVGTRARTAPPKLRLPPLGAASPPGAGATLLPPLLPLPPLPLLPRRPLRSRGPASAPSAPAAGGAAAAAGAGRRPLA